MAGKTKRSGKRKRPNDVDNDKTPDVNDVQLFRPLFDELFDGAKYARINPFSCIRIVKIRPITPGGVMRLMALFRKNYKHVDDPSLTGFALGTDTPVVVELVGPLKHLLIDHFKSEGLSEDKIEEAVAKHDRWYGIIDGAHSNEAVKNLSSNLPEWKGFQWFVTVLSGVQNLERYRQLARAQNARHSPRYYVELTLFDELNNLRLEYEHLKRLQAKPSQIQVARKYFGVGEVSNTRKYLASMAVRLPQCTLKELGIIINKEMPEECLRNASFDSCGATSSREILSTTDCRIFKKFVSLHSLRMSTAFMNASTSTEVQAQCNTLHRAKEYCLLNGLKTVQYTTMNNQFKMALLALKEEEKFLKYLGSRSWPSQMNNIRNNLHRSTILDGEIESNKGNEHTVLSSLRKSLMSISPNQVKECDERLRLSIESSPKPNSEDQDNASDQEQADSPEPATPPTTIEFHEKSSDEVEKETLKKTLSSLSSQGIECVNMDWRQYLSSVWNVDSTRADTIVTEPPPITSRTFLGPRSQALSRSHEEEISKEDVYQMPHLAKRILKPGGYVVIILKFEAFGEWYDAFLKAGYIAMDYPYIFGYRSDSIQDRNPKHLPQSGADFGLISYLPSDQQFCPDFKSVFAELGSNNRRNLAIMTNIPAPRSKLCKPGTRSPFLTSEKSVKLLMEAIDLFTPKAGLSVDMYGGTMTTPLASLIKGRRCICIEKNEQLFKAAVNRLKSCIHEPNIADNDRGIAACIDVQSMEPPLQGDDTMVEGLETEEQFDNEHPEPVANTGECSGTKSNGYSSIKYSKGETSNETTHGGCTETFPENQCNPEVSKVPETVDEINKDGKGIKMIKGNPLETLATAAEQEEVEVRRIGMKRVKCMVSKTLGFRSS